MDLKRTFRITAGMLLLAAALYGQSHIAIDSAVVRKTVEWTMDWTPEKGRGLCVRAHFVGRDSSIVWIQDAIVGKTDSTCAKGQGVLVVISQSWLSAGPVVTVKFMAQMARNAGLPWLCG